MRSATGSWPPLRFSQYAAADAPVRHAVVAKVALTGSTATGEHVHEVTRAYFKHLTLELGGKSPTIIWTALI